MTSGVVSDRKVVAGTALKRMKIYISDVQEDEKNLCT